MPVPFTLPELGENIKGGTITKVLVKVGNQIAKDQPVLEMETDKAVIEVPSPLTGKVLEIHVKEGDKPRIGQLIFTLEGEPDTTVAKAVPKAAPAPTPPPSSSAPCRPGRQLLLACQWCYCCAAAPRATACQTSILGKRAQKQSLSPLLRLS